MKTEVRIWKDGCVVKTDFYDDGHTVEIVPRAIPAVPPTPPAPETFSYEHISKTPGVWRTDGDDDEVRFVSPDNSPTERPAVIVSSFDGAVYIADPEVWWKERFIPAPEQLKDLHITFDTADWRGLCERLIAAWRSKGEYCRELEATNKAIGQTGGG